MLLSLTLSFAAVFLFAGHANADLSEKQRSMLRELDEGYRTAGTNLLNNYNKLYRPSILRIQPPEAPASNPSSEKKATPPPLKPSEAKLPPPPSKSSSEAKLPPPPSKPSTEVKLPPATSGGKPPGKSSGPPSRRPSKKTDPAPKNIVTIILRVIFKVLEAFTGIKVEEITSKK